MQIAHGIMKLKKKSMYFPNLEKRHFKNGVNSQLKLGENEFVSSDNELLSECETLLQKNLQTAMIHELTTCFLETLIHNHCTLRKKKNARAY